ncbi:MAG TPA: hypothetical protein DC058_23395 [Planctomycetaceae bacterium]|nr:hypothetical protein [Planctomycetaceae bacterium]
MGDQFRLGVIGSSGGSALLGAVKCLALAGVSSSLSVVTDRPCGLENLSREAGHEVQRIPFCSTIQFSNDTAMFFSARSITNVLLFYTRRVADPLISMMDVWNIHPSLLPSFRGLHGVRDALDAGSRVVGATLHQVDGELDHGAIVAQVCAPVPALASRSYVEHLSYFQKIWLTLVLYEKLMCTSSVRVSGPMPPAVLAASPGLASDWLFECFREFCVSNLRSEAEFP